MIALDNLLAVLVLEHRGGVFFSITSSRSAKGTFS